MGFGNIGIGELMMIFLVIMVVFGPKRMPGIARDMGKFLRDFRRETNAAIKELKDGIEPINVGIFDEPDASSTKVAGDGAAAPLPGVSAAGGAGVITAPVDPLPNGSRKQAAVRKKTAGARKPAKASSSTTARRKTPASGAGRKASSSASKKRPAQKASKGKSSSPTRARVSRKR
jgi:TatA/E family protein of Tat protein translocase